MMQTFPEIFRSPDVDWSDHFPRYQPFFMHGAQVETINGRALWEGVRFPLVADALLGLSIACFLEHSSLYNDICETEESVQLLDEDVPPSFWEVELDTWDA